MHLSSAVSLPTLVGMGFANAAATAAREIRHSRDIYRAQQWMDHLALSAQYAQEDFENVVTALRVARAEAATLREALDEADVENLALSLDIRRLKSIRAQ